MTPPLAHLLAVHDLSREAILALFKEAAEVSQSDNLANR